MAHRKTKSVRQGRHSTIIEGADKVVAFVQQRCQAKVTNGIITPERAQAQKIIVNKNAGALSMKIACRTGIQIFFVSGITLQNLFDKLFDQFHTEFEVILR